MYFACINKPGKKSCKKICRPHTNAYGGFITEYKNHENERNKDEDD
jgi:hypothetical protein